MSNSTPPEYDHIWYWKSRLPGRKDTLCRILARGRKNSIMVEFEDGCRVITSRYAVRRQSAVLRHVFKNVDYIVHVSDAEDCTLRIGEINQKFDEFLKGLGFKNWAFITPQNPQAKQVSETENQRLLQELKLFLKGRSYFTAHTETPSAIWPNEYGVCIPDILLKDAIGIGRHFAQKAIVYGEIYHAPQLFFC